MPAASGPSGLGAQEHVGAGTWDRDVVLGRLRRPSPDAGPARPGPFERVTQRQLARRAEPQLLADDDAEIARGGPRRERHLDPARVRRPPRPPGTRLQLFRPQIRPVVDEAQRAAPPARPLARSPGRRPRRLTSLARAARDVSSTVRPWPRPSARSTRPGRVRCGVPTRSRRTARRARRREPPPGEARARLRRSATPSATTSCSSAGESVAWRDLTRASHGRSRAAPDAPRKPAEQLARSSLGQAAAVARSGSSASSRTSPIVMTG